MKTFWDHRTFPFNSEVGSVGVGDYASLERFMPDSNRLEAPAAGQLLDSVWAYHKYLPYDHFPDAYGAPKDAPDFTRKAQLINYDQYRGLIEGFSAHAWDWYTGVIIWKTQNPWTAMRGQMYDYYLDPNACLYGLRTAGEMLHAAYNSVDGNLLVVNNTFVPRSHLRLSVTAFDMKGHGTPLLRKWVDVGADTSVTLEAEDIHRRIDSLRASEGLFLSVELGGTGDNFYWLPDSAGKYTGLQTLQKARVTVRVKSITPGKAEVTLTDPANQPPAFFVRLSIIDERTRKRILPAFYTDNYISLTPGQTKTITVDWPAVSDEWAGLSLEGWNVSVRYLTIQ